MKWKTLASKITNRIRSGSSSSPDSAQVVTQDEPSHSPTQNKTEREREARGSSSSSLTQSQEDFHLENVQVSVRIRPLIKDERETETIAWLWENNIITQDLSKLPQKNTTITRAALDQMQSHMSSTNYIFDNLFCPEHSNEQIFNRLVKPTIAKAMQGYHGSIFSYGQTSSGKTFTMNGTSKQPGVIPLSIFECFESIASYRDREFLFRIHDLLNPEVTQIKIQHDPKVGTVLSGVKEQVVMNPAQVIALLQGGEAHRHVGSTDMNEKSSRAHTLFRLIIESKALSDSSDVPIRVSTLNLVDLAGSESAKMTNSKGIRAREAKYINQSLLTLSTIIHRLSEEESSTKTAQHLPYRDSKLTRILQTTLSGNALISIICTISPTIKCVDETNNTLKFATRAKKIKMDARVNETVDDKTLLRAYRLEIEQLKAKLAEVESVISISKANSEAVPIAVTDSVAQIDTEENQQFMLQMIDHMERLILKGEEKAKEEMITQERKRDSSDSHHRKETKSRKSDGKSNSSRKLNSSEAAVVASNKTSPPIKRERETSHHLIESSLDTTPKPSNQRNKTSKIAVRNTNTSRLPPPPAVSGKTKTLNPPTTPFASEKEREKESVKAIEVPPETKPKEEILVDSIALEADDSGTSSDPLPETEAVDSEEETEDFFAGISRNRESILRNSHDVNDSHHHSPSRALIRRLSHTSNGLFGKGSDIHSPTLIENILSGASRDSLLPSSNSHTEWDKATDPVLEGVSQMLSILKQHVQKAKQSIGSHSNDISNEISARIAHGTQRKSATNLPLPPPSLSLSDDNSESSTSHPDSDLIRQLRSELHLKGTENKYLQEELNKSKEQIAAKDNMLNMLTEGLKEVEVNQANLVAANESLSGDLDLVHRAYEEVVAENEILKNEVRRLLICLEAREKQYFEATGRSFESEEF